MFRVAPVAVIGFRRLRMSPPPATRETFNRNHLESFEKKETARQAGRQAGKKQRTPRQDTGCISQRTPPLTSPHSRVDPGFHFAPCPLSPFSCGLEHADPSFIAPSFLFFFLRPLESGKREGAPQARGLQSADDARQTRRSLCHCWPPVGRRAEGRGELAQGWATKPGS